MPCLAIGGDFFDFGQPPFGRLVSEFRRRIFEEVASSELPGLIFTFVWALNLESEKEFIEQTSEIFRNKGGETYFVELEADLSERLHRNETDFRLSQKPPKRNLENSRGHLLAADKESRHKNVIDDHSKFARHPGEHHQPAVVAQIVGQW